MEGQHLLVSIRSWREEGEGCRRFPLDWGREEGMHCDLRHKAS